jgi:hypothetical protein
MTQTYNFSVSSKVRAVYGHFTTFWVIQIFFTPFSISRSLQIVCGGRQVANCRSRFPAPLRSTFGLAALANPHASILLFLANVMRFGPLLDASAARLSIASERMAALNRLGGPE